MAEVKEYKKQMNKSFWKGLLYVALSVWFIPGIFLRLLSFEPKNTDGVVSQLFQFSYRISPDVTSIKEILTIVPKEGGSALLTVGNLLALVIITVFIIGCSLIAGASKQQDKLLELKKQAKYDRMKDEL